MGQSNILSHVFSPAGSLFPTRSDQHILVAVLQAVDFKNPVYSEKNARASSFFDTVV
jgi:hypothetical protein